MPAVIVSATEKSVLEAMAPSPEEVLTAVRKHTTYGASQWGAFVGPRPRITRRAVLGVGWYTTFSWVYGWPDTDWYRQHEAYLRRRLIDDIQAGLREQSADWSVVSMMNYSPAAHGSLSWWSSGQAAETESEHDASLITPSENPIGPGVVSGLGMGVQRGVETVVKYTLGGLAAYVALRLLLKK